MTASNMIDSVKRTSKGHSMSCHPYVDSMSCHFDELPLRWVAVSMSCRFDELPLHCIIGLISKLSINGSHHKETQHKHQLSLYWVLHFLIVMLSAIMLSVMAMEQCTLKNVNNNLKNNIYSYLETSGGRSSILYLNVVHFLNTSIK